MSWPVPLRPNKRSMRLMSTRSCETGHIMGTCLRGGEGLRWYFTHFTPTYIIHQHMLKYHDMSLIVVKRNNDMFWYEFGALKLETWFNAWCLAFLPLKNNDLCQHVWLRFVDTFARVWQTRAWPRKRPSKLRCWVQTYSAFLETTSGVLFGVW